MREIDLAILLRSVLVDGLTSRGITANVKQSNQPRQQGIPTTATVFFFHVGTINVGYPEKKDVWNSGNDNFDHTETQNRESRWQINALAPQLPSSTTAMTAADYALAAAAIMQSDSTIVALKNAGVGVQHITNVRSVWFQDEKQQNEENPTFDVILSHQDISTISTPVVRVFTPTVGVI